MAADPVSPRTICAKGRLVVKAVRTWPLIASVITMSTSAPALRPKTISPTGMCGDSKRTTAAMITVKMPAPMRMRMATKS